MKNEQQLKRAAREALWGQERYIGIKRSRNSASVNWQTKVKIVDGDLPPTLEGHPYLKTTFRNGDFIKTLYTSSTMKIIVGKEWQP